MKILMVCLGNICRSPMAEGIMKKMLEERVTLSWEVDSAAVGDWHRGQLPDSRAIKTAARFDIDITEQRARQITLEDLDYFDHVLVMDDEILESVFSLSDHPAHRQKVRLILDEAYPGENRIVPDPYYSGRFEESFLLIRIGCEAFLAGQGF